MRHLAKASVLFSVGLCMAATLCLGGCGGSGQPSEDDGDKKIIGASLLTQTHIFYQNLVDELQEQADERGYELRVQYAEFDATKQNNQVETFLLQQVDALILAPVDSSSIAPVIQDARDKDIPVFTVDIKAYGAPVVSHIASDNVEGGRIIGEYLADLLDGEGTVAIIDHPEVASVIDRTNGFMETINEYPDIEVVARPPGGGERDKSLSATQDVLQAHPNLDAIFGINDFSALGALAAVEAAGKEDEIVIVGYDGTPEAREAILEGTALKADTVQYPRAIGRTAMDTIEKYFNGEDVPEEIPVKVGIIDQESLQQEAAAEQGEGQAQ